MKHLPAAGFLTRKAWVRSVLAVTGFVMLLPAGGGAQAPVDPATIVVPLAVTENPDYGTYKATVNVAIGSVRALPFGFDTGSSGLHVFADAHLDARGSGVECSHEPTSVTYGNPARITFSGVVCHARLRFGNAVTPYLVPIAYLTQATCLRAPCTPPNLSSPKAMGGYGVFGAGITGIMSGGGNVPNPILAMPGRFGSRFSVRLTPGGGELTLGASAPPNARSFPLYPGTVAGERWGLGSTCLFVNGSAIGRCPYVSFDTGNGVPWIHNVDSSAIPQSQGVVTPGTVIGFAPRGGLPATFVTAGAAFSNTIRDEAIPGLPSPITNPGIQGFFDRIVTYDNENGTIAIAPAPR